jgi:hypothetical protein
VNATLGYRFYEPGKLKRSRLIAALLPLPGLHLDFTGHGIGLLGARAPPATGAADRGAARARSTSAG